jgi:hypothetical protein
MGTKIDNKGNVGKINITEQGNININEQGQNKPNSVWSNGIFFLLELVIIGVGIYFISIKTISIYMFLLILVGLILIFTMVGAFVLKASGNYPDEKFENLMKLVFSKIPVLSLFVKGKPTKPR